ncbi:unnamed protein product [Brassica napus]|nr:unnamed protein product [Brassica napus]
MKTVTLLENLILQDCFDQDEKEFFCSLERKLQIP